MSSEGDYKPSAVCHERCRRPAPSLTTQIPFEVWLAIDRKAWRSRLEQPPPRVVYLSGATLREGIEEDVAGGVVVRVFSAAKTVADCFKCRNKIGTDVAVEAAGADRLKLRHLARDT